MNILRYRSNFVDFLTQELTSKRVLISNMLSEEDFEDEEELEEIEEEARSICSEFGPLLSLELNGTNCNIEVEYASVADALTCIESINETTVLGSQIKAAFEDDQVVPECASSLLLFNFCSLEELEGWLEDEEEYEEVEEEIFQLFGGWEVPKASVSIQPVRSEVDLSAFWVRFLSSPLSPLPPSSLSFPLFILSFPLSTLSTVFQFSEMDEQKEAARLGLAPTQARLQTLCSAVDGRKIGGRQVSVHSLFSLGANKRVYEARGVGKEARIYQHPYLLPLPSDPQQGEKDEEEEEDEAQKERKRAILETSRRLLRILANYQREARKAGKKDSKKDNKKKPVQQSNTLSAPPPPGLLRFFVTGMREVLRGVRARSIQAVFLANRSMDWGTPLEEEEERAEGKGGGEEEDGHSQEQSIESTVRANLDEIVGECEERGIPVFGNISSQFLKKAIKNPRRIKILGVYSFEGAFQEKKELFRYFHLL